MVKLIILAETVPSTSEAGWGAPSSLLFFAHAWPWLLVKPTLLRPSSLSSSSSVGGGSTSVYYDSTPLLTPETLLQSLPCIWSHAHISTISW